MAFSFSGFNNNFNRFKVEPDENATYYKPVELVDADGDDTTYNMVCCYINSKGKFGSHPVAGFTCENPASAFAETISWLSLPQHLTETFEKILEDDNAVNAINNGECHFKLKKLHTKKYDKDFFTVEFVD